MTHIEQAIRDAVEKGGYGGGYRYQEAKDLLNNDRIFLDPNFWQALGKARGWDKPVGKNYDWPVERTILSNLPNSWLYNWHRFIDHLAEGKAAEAFFADLNSSQSI